MKATATPHRRLTTILRRCVAPFIVLALVLKHRKRPLPEGILGDSTRHNTSA